jgi:5-methylcytosine-specific restriction endonuclease McrA
MNKIRIAFGERGWKNAAARIGVSSDEYMARIMMGEKWCSACKAWHSRWIFPIDRSRGDGLAASCRNYKPTKLPLSPQEQRNKANASYRAYYAGSGGARIRATKYARKRGIDRVDPWHREILFDGFHGECAYCGAPATTIDHIIPVKHGGTSRRGNIVPACVSCNSRKKTKLLDDFLKTCPKANIDEIINELSMLDV